MACHCDALVSNTDETVCNGKESSLDRLANFVILTQDSTSLLLVNEI